MRPPALTNVGHYIDDLEGCEEAILNAFFQAISIDWLPEITEVGDVLGFLGGGGHTDLGCRLEIFQNPAPAALFLGRTSVTLVHDNQVEEVRGKQLAEMFLVIIAHQLLIQREVNLVGRDGAFVVLRHVDFVGDLLQRGKVLLDGLVHQNVPVRQIQNLSLHAALQQPVHDLEGGVGLARAGGHDQKKPLLPPGDSIHRTVDGVALVIARWVGVLAGIVGLLL